MRLHLIYTGGTIGMVHNERGDLVPYDFADLLDRVPELGALGATFCTSVLEPLVDSSDFHPSDWTRLADLIWAEAPHADAFVVLHGTDTMAYTASALSFALLGLNLPVVLTGSQLPMGVPRSDARENLITAVEVARARDAHGKPVLREVAVYFEYTLYRGNRVYKQSSEDFNAFDSPNFPALASAGVKLVFAPSVEEGAARQAAAAQRRAEGAAPHTRFDPAVGWLPFYPGIDETFVHAVLNSGRKAVLLQTFGTGNVPSQPWLAKALGAARERGIHLIQVSHCRKGGVGSSEYAAGRILQEVGVLSAGDTTLEAALVKAMWLLAQDLSADAFQTVFARNLAGERSEG
jgi:L-asparaginase